MYPVVFRQSYFMLLFYPGPEIKASMHRLPRSRVGPRPPWWNLQRRWPTTDLRTSVCLSAPEHKREVRKWGDSFHGVVPVGEHFPIPTLNPPSNGGGGDKWVVLFSPRWVGRDFKEASLREPVACLPQPQRHRALGCDSLLRSPKGFERLPSGFGSLEGAVQWSSR